MNGALPAIDVVYLRREGAHFVWYTPNVDGRSVMSHASHQHGRPQQPTQSRDPDRMPDEEDTRVATFDREEPPRAAHLHLNDRFVEELGDAKTRDYVDALVSTAQVAGTGARPGEVRDALDRALDEAVVTVSTPERDNIVDELVRARGRLHVSARGRVVYGDPRLDDTSFEPDVHGVEDPQDPDRPALA